jgi:hypothetical protein
MELFGTELNYIFGIKMNEKECFRSVPIRNVPLHRKENPLRWSSFGIHIRWWR